MKVMIGVPSDVAGGPEALKGVLQDKFGITPFTEKPFSNGAGMYYSYAEFDSEKMLETALKSGATAFHQL